MNENRLEEIKQISINNPDMEKFLYSLPENKYRVAFEILKLVDFLEQQKITDNDIKAANDVYIAYELINNEKMALMAFIYGKIQGKREERLKHKRR